MAESISDRSTAIPSPIVGKNGERADPCPRWLVGKSMEETVRLVQEMGYEAYRARQLFRQVHLKGVIQPARMTDIPTALRCALEDNGWGDEPAPLSLELTSEDGTSKLGFRLHDGNMVEGVLIRGANPEKVTQCISTQAGCAMGCRFCRTAAGGLVRNLHAAEIVGQVISGRAALARGERVSNLVFMGMGEPLANLQAVVQALQILTHPDGPGLSPRRITVSTCGITPRIRPLLEAVPVSLAISLNGTTQAQREELMPGVAKAYALHDLLEECRRLPIAPRRRITFEYVLLPGFNDSPQDARRLASSLRGLKAKINLIPYNAYPGAPFREPSPEQMESFGGAVRRLGFTVSVRHSKGKDVMGACGQLSAEGGPGDR